MTALQPYVRLVSLLDNTVVASTTNVTGYSWESVLDASPKLTITVPLADAGDGGAGSASFATILLVAAGGPGLPFSPTPLELEFGLGGPGGPIDTRTTSFSPERKMASGELVIEVSNEDCYGALYSTMPAGGGRTTMTDISLSDALSGAQGSIKPIDTTEQNRLLSADGSIPYLYGLLTQAPSAPSWDPSATTRVTYTAVCASAVSGLPTYLDSLADTVARAVLAVANRVGGAVIPGDEAAGVPQGTRGHLVVDPSDEGLNLSQWVS